jgi:hypothetical protein
VVLKCTLSPRASREALCQKFMALNPRIQEDMFADIRRELPRFAIAPVPLKFPILTAILGLLPLL